MTSTFDSRVKRVLYIFLAAIYIGAIQTDSIRCVSTWFGAHRVKSCSIKTRVSFRFRAYFASNTEPIRLCSDGGAERYLWGNINLYVAEKKLTCLVNIYEGDATKIDSASMLPCIRGLILRFFWKIRYF